MGNNTLMTREKGDRSLDGSLPARLRRWETGLVVAAVGLGIAAVYWALGTVADEGRDLLFLVIGSVSTLAGQGLQRRWHRADLRELREAEREAARSRQLQDRSDEALRSVLNRLDRARSLYEDAESVRGNVDVDEAQLGPVLDGLERDAAVLLNSGARGRVRLAIDALDDASMVASRSAVTTRSVVWSATTLVSRSLEPLLRDEPLPPAPERMRQLEATLLELLEEMTAGEPDGYVTDQLRQSVERWHASDRWPVLGRSDNG